MLLIHPMKPMPYALSYSVLVSLCLSSAAVAQPTQSLSDFLYAGRKNALSNQGARIDIERKRAEKDESHGRLLPSISASAGYRYNFRDANICIPEIVQQPMTEDGEELPALPKNECETDDLPIGGMDDPNAPVYRNRYVNLLPHHQLDAGVTLRWSPTLESLHQYRAAKHRLSATASDAQAAAAKVDLEVSQAYYKVIELSGMVATANTELENATTLLEVVRERVKTGAAQPLEEQAAQLDIKRVTQKIIAIQRDQKAFARKLSELTGISPDLSQFETLKVPATLSDEPVVESWLNEINNLGAVKSAEIGTRAAEEGLKAAQSRYLPRVSLEVSQRYTSIDGLEGRNNYFYAGVNAAVDWDFSKNDTLRIARTAKKSAKVKLEQERNAAEGAIYAAHERILNIKDQMDFAKQQRAYVENVNALIHSRYESGLVTISKVFDAERALYESKAKELQLFTDYLTAKAELRIVTGKDLTKAKSSRTRNNLELIEELN